MNPLTICVIRPHTGPFTLMEYKTPTVPLTDTPYIKALFNNRAPETIVIDVNEDSSKEYFIILFDANEGGEPNPHAVWLASRFQIPPTGNFVITRKVFDKVKGEDEVVPFGMTHQEFEAFLDIKVAH